MKNCDAGCSHFECGSIGHLKTCENYPNSMQFMIDEKNEKIEKLTDAFNKLLEQYEGDFNNKSQRPLWVSDILNIN
jgi:hypothetical protein